MNVYRWVHKVRNDDGKQIKSSHPRHVSLIFAFAIEKKREILYKTKIAFDLTDLKLTLRDTSNLFIQDFILERHACYFRR